MLNGGARRVVRQATGIRYQETAFKSSNLCSHMCGLVLPVATRMRKLSHGGEVAHTGVA